VEGKAQGRKGEMLQQDKCPEGIKNHFKKF
jgi:hypothetical protein